MLGLRPPRKKQSKAVNSNGKHYPGDPQNFHEEIGFVVPKKDFRKWDANRNHSFPVHSFEKTGFCGCGCGQKTGRVKNPVDGGRVFNRFISGHQWLLRRRLYKPKGWKSTYEIQREYDAERNRVVEAAARLPRLKGGVLATFDDLRQALGEIKVNGKAINNNGISRMLTVGTLNGLAGYCPRLVSVRRAPVVGEISQFYPFGIISRTSENDLLFQILDIIPDKITSLRRGDLAQDIALEILAGRHTIESAKADMQALVNGSLRRFGWQSHLFVSLDAPIGELADTKSLHDLIDGQAVMQEMHGGINFDTQQNYFEHSEAWDGQVCGRY